MREATPTLLRGKRAIAGVLQWVLGALTVVVALLVRPRRQTIFWGPDPLINVKYWSRAMRLAGYDSLTFVRSVYQINARSDFDCLYDDVIPRWVRPRGLREVVAPHVAFLYTLRHASVLHTSFSGGPLGELTFWWRFEAPLYRRAGIRTVIMAYGADAFCYSRLTDPVLRHVLLLSYPNAARSEREIARRVDYWCAQADFVLGTWLTDGVGRWDIPMGSPLAIDTAEWPAKTRYSDADGRSAPVRVLHTPNHRGFKGTEFLIAAVEALRAEGLQIELVLLERVSNDVVRAEMQHADVLAEQFIIAGYGLSGIEGMATGLPVLANLDESRTQLFRRYSYLEQCPVVSTNPETLVDNLRRLVTQPETRRCLGEAGRVYAERYHSLAAAQRLYHAIYARLLRHEEVDLMNLYRPAPEARLANES